jgi:hypothetical protein
MEKQSVTKPGSKDAQLAAFIASCAITVGFVVYWTLQIQSVREMLALAYG